MRLIQLFLILVVAGTAHAQRDLAAVNQLVDEFTERLEDRSIADYFTANRYCEGKTEMFKLSDGSLCSSRGTYHAVYLFWNEPDGIAMIKKFDNCGMYLSLPLSDPSALEFVAKHSEGLKTGLVKKYQTAAGNSGPRQRTAIHNCYRRFSFHQAGERFGQDYNMLHLTNASEAPNLNYDHNAQLKVVMLDQQIDTILETYEPKFRRLD